MQNEKLSMSGKRPLRIWGMVLIGLIVLFVGAYYLKISQSRSNRLTKNRIAVQKICVLGKEIPNDIGEKVDLKLLEQDAAEGNKKSQFALALIRYRKNAEELFALGKPLPKGFPKDFDLDLLKKDAEAGYVKAQTHLELLNNRELVKVNCLLGKAIPVDFFTQVDLSLVKEDAQAGNETMADALKLIDYRNRSTALCALGKPFKYDFFIKLKRSSLEADAKAGYEPAKQLLDLADMRIAAEKLTIHKEPYQKDFFTHVDKDLLKKDADAGNPDMQYIWARLHGQGVAIKKDIKVEFDYYTRAAAQGNAKAQCHLAIYYLSGKDVPKDTIKGIKLLRESAEAGYHYAEYQLGQKYLTGSDVRRDTKKAEYWLKKAVKQRDPQAVKSLIWVYSITRPLSIKRKLNIPLYRLGCEMGDADCMGWYGEALISGYVIKKNIPLGVEYIKKSAAKDSYVGLSQLSEFYWSGAHNVKKNIPESIRLSEKHIDRTFDPFQLLRLAKIYSTGAVGIDKDLKKSFKYLKMSCDSGGVPFCGMLLAKQYLYGHGVEKDNAKAIAVLKRTAGCAKNGFKKEAGEALNLLGSWYLKGEGGIMKDAALGIECYSKGIELGDRDCMVNLAKQLISGENIQQNVAEGIKLLKLAESKRSLWAAFELATYYETGKYGLEKDINMALTLYKKSSPQFSAARIAVKRIEAVLGK